MRRPSESSRAGWRVKVGKPQLPLLTADDLIADRALNATDPDTLDHLPIAERLAELVTSADAPVNVVLFGPWGSGKSSFSQLLKRALADQKVRTTFVVYDTWTSAGESFQRSFISQAASELGFKRDSGKGHNFHSGLYERTRRVRVSGAEVRRFIVSTLIFSAAAFLVIGSLAWFFSWTTATPFATLIPTTLPPWITASGVLGVIASGLKEGLAGARFDVETSAPTQEQFRQTFRDLVAAAKRKHKADRLVFFLDELDRCMPEQVVQVLSAVKHFLDQPFCVFVVAADRDVVERALKDLPQATPMTVEAPYYSSASEFIDKVFQHQLALPPLRMRRLNHFARELVDHKPKGIWREIRTADAEGRLRDEVLYVAVPRHVRSPRRVKVLLNNFATNARIAQARGIDWLSRATEIAKLTALQTEFPLLAADLHREPRLLAFLLDPPTKSSPRLSRLLNKHRLPLLVAEEAGGDGEIDATATDRLLVDASNEIEVVQRRQLLAYLRGTSEYRNPSLDLLFLEDAGKAVDLSDPLFAEILETAAIEEPQRVVEAAQRQSPEDQGRALGVLADVVTDEVGRERANATTALLGVARLLDYEIHPRAYEVVAALRIQERDAGFDDEHLADVLAVALKAGAPDLVTVVLGNDQLWATPERVGTVAGIADQLSEAQRPAVWTQVGTAYLTSDDPLVIPLKALPPEVAEEMLDSDPVQASITARLARVPDSDDPLPPPAAGLLAAVEERTDGQALLRGSVIWDLLVNEPGYAAAREHIELLDQMDEEPGLRNACALLAMEKYAPLADLPLWAQRIGGAGDDAWENEGRRAISVLARTFTEWEDDLGLPDVVAQLIPLVPADADEDTATAVLDPLNTAMAAAWWGTNEATLARQLLHAVALSLREIGDTTAAAASAAVVVDLKRALATPPQPNYFQHVLDTVSAAAPALTAGDQLAIAETLHEIAAPEPLDIELIKQQLIVAAIVGGVSLPVDGPPFAISAQKVLRLKGEADFDDYLERWVALNPSPEEFSAVLTSIVTTSSTRAHRAAGDWGQRRTPLERTVLLLDLLEASADISRWVETIAASPIEELRFVEAVAARVRALTRADERADYLRSLSAFQPASQSAQRAIADLVIWLLDQETKADFQNAMLLLAGLGSNHSSAARMTSAFKRAGDRGYEPKGQALEHLYRAGVTLTRKRMSKAIWERWRRLRR